MRVLTVGAYNHIDKIKEEIDKRLCNMSPCVLKPNCVVYKKGFIEFLQYEIEDEVLVQNYEFFFSDTIKLYASDAIVEFIMAYTRFYIVRKIVEEQCAEYLKDEQDQIVEMVRTFFYHPENDVDGSLPNYSYRKEVLETLIEFFDEGNEFVLEGFIQFRLKKYKKTLKTVVAQMKKEYDTQKEYKEFLRLLKYFVDVQETSTEMVHIVGMDDGGFQLFDKNKDDITQQSIAEFEKDFEIQDVNEDDLLVSTLITIAPRNIIIHRKDMIQNKQLVETIANIFQGKIAFCTGCELCESGNENQST